MIPEQELLTAEPSLAPMHHYFLSWVRSSKVTEEQVVILSETDAIVLCRAVHAYNPSTQEAEASSRPDRSLHNEFHSYIAGSRLASCI